MLTSCCLSPPLDLRSPAPRQRARGLAFCPQCGQYVPVLAPPGRAPSVFLADRHIPERRPLYFYSRRQSCVCFSVADAFKWPGQSAAGRDDGGRRDRALRTRGTGRHRAGTGADGGSPTKVPPPGVAQTPPKHAAHADPLPDRSLMRIK